MGRIGDPILPIRAIRVKSPLFPPHQKETPKVLSLLSKESSNWLEPTTNLHPTPTNREEIMGNLFTQKTNAGGRAILVFAVAALLAVSLTLGVVGATLQAPTAKPGAKVAFEVASVKLFDPSAGPGRPGMFQNFGPPCGFTGLQI